MSKLQLIFSPANAPPPAPNLLLPLTCSSPYFQMFRQKHPGSCLLLTSNCKYIFCNRQLSLLYEVFPESPHMVPDQLGQAPTITPLVSTASQASWFDPLEISSSGHTPTHCSPFRTSHGFQPLRSSLEAILIALSPGHRDPGSTVLRCPSRERCSLFTRQSGALPSGLEGGSWAGRPRKGGGGTEHPPQSGSSAQPHDRPAVRVGETGREQGTTVDNGLSPASRHLLAAAAFQSLTSKEPTQEQPK